VQGEPPKCDKRLAAPSGSPRRPADPASPSTSSRELRCATPLLATYGDASNIETPAASASQPIWHFQRSSVPKQLRPDIRSQYSWQVSQSNWPPTDWAAGLSAAGIVKTVLRKRESCRVECGTDRRRTPAPSVSAFGASQTDVRRSPPEHRDRRLARLTTGCLTLVPGIPVPHPAKRPWWPSWVPHDIETPHDSPHLRARPVIPLGWGPRRLCAV